MPCLERSLEENYSRCLPDFEVFQRKQIKEVVEIELIRLDLKKHANKRSGKYRLVNTVTQYHCKLPANAFKYLEVMII